MYRKSFLRNSLLISGFAISAIILSAQVSNNDSVKRKAESQQAAYPIQEPELSEENAEGMSELENIARRYGSKNMYLSGEILYYSNADSATVSPEKTWFTSIVTPLGSSYEIDSVQTIINAGIMLFVDKREKSIALMEQETEAQPIDFQKVISNDLTQFREYISSIKVMNEGKDKKLVIMFKEDSPAQTSSYEMIYEPETYRLKKVRMEIVEGEFTDNMEEQNPEDELVFEDENHSEISTGYYAKAKVSVYEVIYKTEKEADSNLVDINHFVKKSGDVYISVGAFKNYELLN